MKSLFCTAGAVLLLGACASMDEDLPPPPAGMPAAMPAAAYVPSAASGDMFEIESGRLALQRACDPAVRNLAQMLVADHTRTSNLLMQATQTANLPPPPTQMAPHHAQMLQRLQSAPSSSFDAAFRSEQIAAHQEALRLHRSYADTGDIPALRNVAVQAVGPIEMHLRTAEGLAPRACSPATDPATPRRGERG